ncbi:hypothetical protein AB0P28_15115 [Pseudarthrobacter sp. NPDC089323]
MFARVSTYRPGPDNTGAPTEDTIRKVLDLPGCRGLYYLYAANNKALSISLWDDEKVLADSRPAADKIRSETSAEQHLQILDVEEFEVLASQFKD